MKGATAELPPITIMRPINNRSIMIGASQNFFLALIKAQRSFIISMLILFLSWKLKLLKYAVKNIFNCMTEVTFFICNCLAIHGGERDYCQAYFHCSVFYHLIFRFPLRMVNFYNNFSSTIFRTLASIFSENLRANNFFLQLDIS